jgi:hypothetical protein
MSSLARFRLTSDAGCLVAAVRVWQSPGAAWRRGGGIVRSQIYAFAGIVATLCVLATPAAHAFSVQDKDAADLPKFDLQEQLQNFRTGSPNAQAPGKTEFETFLGKGSLQFGTQQGPSYFGSSLGPGLSPGWGLGVPSRNTRDDFNRMIVPDSLR